MHRTLVVALTSASLLLAWGCSDDDGGSGGSGGMSSGTMAGTGGSGNVASSNTSSSTATTAAGGSSVGGGGGSADCMPLPIPNSNVVDVTNAAELVAAVQNVTAGAAIVLADGIYDLTGGTLFITEDNVTIMGGSQNAANVIIEGGYDTASGGLISISGASNVTVAHLTLQHPRFHAVHVTAQDSPLVGTRLHDIRAIDPGEQAIKINHSNQGGYPDDGEISCSQLTLTEAGRQQVMQYTSSGSNCYTGGVDAHDARGWLVRDNTVTGFYCHNDDLAEHGVHFWTGSRDTVVVRNHFVDNARAIGFGLVGGGRTYTDDPCSGINDAGHYGGLVINNTIVATDPALFASPNGMDLGIGMWHACGAVVAHNSVASTEAPFSSIEWRFGDTSVELYNNLVSHTLRERGGASATQEGNLESAALSNWVDVAGGDLHLVSGAAAVGQGGPLGVAVAPNDVDGESRPATTPDVGADQL